TFQDGLGRFARRLRQLLPFDEVKIGQGAPALVQPQSVSGEELVGNGEADVTKWDVLDEPPVRAVEERHRRQARGLAKRERTAEEVERQPRVHDVFDDDDVAPGERYVDVLQQAYAAVSTLAVRGELDDIEGVRDGHGSREIGEEDDTRLEG